MNIGTIGAGIVVLLFALYVWHGIKNGTIK
jgi:hypothetical protein